VAGDGLEAGAGARAFGTLRPHAQEHDPRHLEHTPGHLHPPDARRNPQDEDAWGEAGAGDSGGVLLHRPIGRRHGEPGPTGRPHRPTPDRRGRNLGGTHFANPGRARKGRDLRQVHQAAVGADPQRRLPTDRPAGRRPVGRPRSGDQCPPGRAQRRPHPRPRLPAIERNQRHHERPLAIGAAPGARASGEVRGRGVPHGESAGPGTVSRRGAAGPLSPAQIHDDLDQRD